MISFSRKRSVHSRGHALCAIRARELCSRRRTRSSLLRYPCLRSSLARVCLNRACAIFVPGNRRSRERFRPFSDIHAKGIGKTKPFSCDWEGSVSMTRVLGAGTEQAAPAGHSAVHKERAPRGARSIPGRRISPSTGRCSSRSRRTAAAPSRPRRAVPASCKRRPRPCAGRSSSRCSPVRPTPGCPRCGRSAPAAR